MNDEEFLRQFETCGLTHAEWTHRAHVKTAYLFLRRYPFTEALSRLRKGIQALNAAHRIVESPTRGYNETTTRAFLQLIAATMEACEERSSADADPFCDRHPQLMSRHALRFFYSPERQQDPRSKAEFLEPDLAPLPRFSGDPPT